MRGPLASNAFGCCIRRRDRARIQRRPAPRRRADSWTTTQSAVRQCGAVAQLGERCVRNAEVRGSIPLSSTTFQETNRSRLVFFTRNPQCWRGFGPRCDRRHSPPTSATNVVSTLDAVEIALVDRVHTQEARLAIGLRAAPLTDLGARGPRGFDGAAQAGSSRHCSAGCTDGPRRSRPGVRRPHRRRRGRRARRAYGWPVRIAGRAAGRGRPRRQCRHRCSAG